MNLDELLNAFGFSGFIPSDRRGVFNQEDRMGKQPGSRPGNSLFEDDEYFLNQSFGGIIQEAEEIFKRFDAVTRNSMYTQGIDFGGIEPIEGTISEKSARDRMLKKPDDAIKRVDRDLDDQVAKEGLDKVLKNRDHLEPSAAKKSRIFGTFSSNVYSKQDLGDGRVKEYRSFLDSEGNKHEETRKAIGDKSYSVTKKTSRSGQVQRIEEFEGLEEQDIRAFKREFENKPKKPLWSLPKAYDRSHVTTEIYDHRPWKSYIIDNFSKWF